MGEVSDRATGMLETMARMQDEHNCQVHADWRLQGYAYYRAIWVECAEMLDHFGWKWWKKQAPDLDQVKLELVDIWHFALSELLRADNLGEEVAQRLALVRPAAGDGEAFRLAIEELAEMSLKTRSFEIEPFIAAMENLPLSYEELFSLYIGKNVLNRFRQDHGYKEGTYRKTWHGREDNEHLIELINHLSVPPDELPGTLYDALASRYREIAQVS